MDPISPADISRIDQVCSADGHAVLERLDGSEALRAGGVNIVGLDAIRSKLADRWPAKRARVWEHVERDLERRLGPQDLFFRLDEANYLVAMPTTPSFMAQAACLAILQDVLKFFLGESEMRDVKVRAVSSVSGGQIVSNGVDPASIIENAARAAAASIGDQASPPAQNWKPPLAGRTHSMSFMTEQRRKAEVKMGVEGVWNLRTGMIGSFVLERVINPALDHPADVMRADCAVMSYAADLLKEHKERGGRLTLHLPISYSSAAIRQSRERVLASLSAIRELLRSTVLFEIVDLDPGVPPSRLVEVTALLRPFCMGVLARVKPTRTALAAVRGCNLQGLALDALDLDRPPAELGQLMRAFAEVAHGVSPNILVHNLPASPLVDIAGKVGMTHASVRPDLTFETQIDAA
ncbi:MAG TPA: hypothetical protein VFN88_10285 [Caulobacteraceae bacterium]|nr:hypothetical protein [Caulobacteraceae bacterium]